MLPLPFDVLADPEPEVISAISLISGSHNIYPCDRLACDRMGSIYLVCVTGNGAAMKALFAFMCSNAKGYLEVPDKHAMTLTVSNGDRAYPKKFSKVEGGYRIYRKKMKYGLWHCALVTRATNFIASISDEALWQHLNQPWYTTPLVRVWVPAIRKRLITKGKLRETYGFQTRCGLIALTNDELDKIVTEGLYYGEFDIPEGD